MAHSTDDAMLVELGIQENMPEVFKKSHELIFSRQRMSSHEQNVFNLMIAHMREDHWEGKTPSYEFPAQTLSDWFDIKSNHLSSTLAPVADRLASRTVGFINEETKEWDYLPLLSRIRYKNGKLIIIPNPQLKEQYIDHQKKGYALINRKPLYRLRRTYSKRLYEMISRFKDYGYKQRPLTINELKGYLGLLDEKGNLSKEHKSLSPTGVFIKRCVADAFEEIAEVCKHELMLFKSENGQLGYSLIKKGRTTVAVKFHYKWMSGKATMGEEAAKEMIKTLETKLRIRKEELNISELTLLAEAYQRLGDPDTASEIYLRVEEKEQATEVEPELNAIKEKQAFLDKIKKMKELNPDISY